MCVLHVIPALRLELPNRVGKRFKQCSRETAAQSMMGGAHIKGSRTPISRRGRGVVGGRPRARTAEPRARPAFRPADERGPSTGCRERDERESGLERWGRTEQGGGRWSCLCNGSGFVVYSWRHKLRAMCRGRLPTEVAADMRGYGRAMCPPSSRATRCCTGWAHGGAALDERRATAVI